MQGSFLLTTVENWTALGGLDESYFMYVEDVDFCKRTQLRGLLCVYYPLSATYTTADTVQSAGIYCIQDINVIRRSFMGELSQAVLYLF